MCTLEAMPFRVLQVVALLRDALAAAGLGLYLAPYGVLPTDYECGIIEVRLRTRTAMGGQHHMAGGAGVTKLRSVLGEQVTPLNLIATQAGLASCRWCRTRSRAARWARRPTAAWRKSSAASLASLARAATRPRVTTSLPRRPGARQRP